MNYDCMKCGGGLQRVGPFAGRETTEFVCIKCRTEYERAGDEFFISADWESEIILAATAGMEELNRRSMADSIANKPGMVRLLLDLREITAKIHNLLDE